MADRVEAGNPDRRLAPTLHFFCDTVTRNGMNPAPIGAGLRADLA